MQVSQCSYCNRIDIWNKNKLTRSLNSKLQPLFSMLICFTQMSMPATQKHRVVHDLWYPYACPCVCTVVVIDSACICEAPFVLHDLWYCIIIVLINNNRNRSNFTNRGSEVRAHAGSSESELQQLTPMSLAIYNFQLN